AMIDARHDGYMGRLGLAHRRRLLLQEQGDVLRGEETLDGRADVPYCLRFHLHPNIQAVPVQDGEEILLRARSGTGWR
ncbi:heparinase II/III domain-containing protein, partial [Streptococcus pyogenes]